METVGSFSDGHTGKTTVFGPSGGGRTGSSCGSVTRDTSRHMKGVTLSDTPAGVTPLPGVAFDGKKVITSREAMNFPKQPKKIAIIGAGAIGCEFADFYNAVGTEVVIVEMLDHVEESHGIESLPEREGHDVALDPRTRRGRLGVHEPFTKRVHPRENHPALAPLADRSQDVPVSTPDVEYVGGAGRGCRGKPAFQESRDDVVPGPKPEVPLFDLA